MDTLAESAESIEPDGFTPLAVNGLNEKDKPTGTGENPRDVRRKRYFEHLTSELRRIAETRARGGIKGKPHRWIGPLVDALAVTPVLERACEQVGISWAVVDYWRKRVPAIEEEIQRAVERGVDRVEAAAFDRAVTGHQRPIYQGGQKVGEETVYSDRLAEMILRGRRRAVYGDRTELTGAGGGPLQVVLSCQAPPKRERMEATAELAPSESETDRSKPPDE